jgi:arginase family enzyme
MDRPLSIVTLACRTSDREAGGAQGALALAAELGRRRGLEPRVVGRLGEPRVAGFADDLRDSRGCLLEAGGQVDDALAAGAFPVLFASDCSICIATLPAVLRHVPDVTVLWLDAHGDFNTPDTTPSGFLGGMCLAAACGAWDAGFDGPRVDPAQIVMCGVRDLDGGERVLLETRGVGVVERPSELAGLVAGRRVFVHLDLDVLDPSVLPARFPAPGGLSDGGLRTLLSEVAQTADVVGCEITAFAQPDRARRVATIVEPLMSQAAP